MPKLITFVDGVEISEDQIADSVPEMVTTFQARAALMAVGLFEAVDAHCKTAGGVVFQAWEYANHFYRQGSLVTSLAPAFGLTSEQLDDLFRQAALVDP